MSMEEAEKQGFGRVALKGAMIMTALRWAVRFIGLISISITARILTPADFGIHSTAAIVMSLFLILQYLGINELLIKRKDMTDAVVNTCWTVRLTMSAAVTGILLLIAEPAAHFLKEPRAVTVLTILAFVPLIDALANPRLVLLPRTMDFGQLFIMRFIERILSFSGVVGFVVVTQAFWGIAAGTVCASICFTLYTHIRWKKLPRLALSHVGEVSRFAGVAFLRSTFAYISTSADSIAARQFVSSELFAGFHNTKDLAQVLVVETSQPISQATMPAMSRLREQPQRFSNAFRNSFGAMFILVVGLSTGVFLTASEAILILLGDQWTFAIEFLRWWAFVFALAGLGNVLGTFYVALDKQGLLAIAQGLRAGAIALSCYLLVSLESIEAIMQTMLAVNALVVCLMLAGLLVLTGLKITVLFTLVRPILAAIAMYMAAQYIFDIAHVNALPLILAAVAKALIGGLLYVTCVAALWIAFGKPDGPEHALLTQVTDALSSKRARSRG